MPLVSIQPELRKAQREHYGILHFDVFDLQCVEGLMQAIDDKQAPAIIAIYTGLLDQPYTRAFALYCRQRAEESRYPVAIILDHGASFAQCMKAISLGFTDVMFDGSRLPIEQNIAITRLMVQAAHAVGAGAEAELGHVGQGSDYDTFGSKRHGFTDPADVERFVAETGVDALAVAIGNAHGDYKGEPKLDIALLKEIRARTDVPLVLHGGSGIPVAQFQAAIAAGIAKVNIATDCLAAGRTALAEGIAKEGCSYSDLSDRATAAFRERCGWYMDIFGSTGKAG